MHWIPYILYIHTAQDHYIVVDGGSHPESQYPFPPCKYHSYLPNHSRQRSFIRVMLQNLTKFPHNYIFFSTYVFKLSIINNSTTNLRFPENKAKY